MTKRVLVVDNGIRDFQYMIVDIDGAHKDISKYHCIEGSIHSSSLAKMIEEIFEENKCNEIHIDAIGTGLTIVEFIDKKYHDKTMLSRCTAIGIHEAICDLMSDLRQRKLFICKDSVGLYAILEQMSKEKSIYFNDNGLCKVGKDLGHDVRRQLQLILGLYMCLRRQCRLYDNPNFKDLKGIK